MDKFLYIGIAAGAVLLAATVAMILKRRCKDTGMLCIRETWMTAVLGLMVIALGFALPVMKLVDPSLMGTESTNVWYVIGFGLACHLVGDFALLFTFVKCTVLYKDRAVEYGSFGDQHVIYWEDVVRVEKPMMKSAYVMTDRNGKTVTVSGDKKASQQFVDFAKEKVKNASGKDLLHQVEHRLNGRHL